MRHSAIGLSEIADWHNLATAFHTAARGKRGRPDVETFRANLNRELAAMRAGLLDGSIPVGEARAFRIRDPKPRIIHAPSFRQRVPHHAIMAHVGPVLDRSLVDDTYACREGKGALAAVHRVRAHAARYPWFVQIDIAGYFAHIDHAVLIETPARTFGDRAPLTLLSRIVVAHADGPGRGLPIGALTSQHFANFYLSPADRMLLDDRRVGGLVRYMDDLIWWTDDRRSARETLRMARDFLSARLRLTVNDPPRVGDRRARGLPRLASSASRDCRAGIRCESAITSQISRRRKETVSHLLNPMHPRSWPSTAARAGSRRIAGRNRTCPSG